MKPLAPLLVALILATPAAAQSVNPGNQMLELAGEAQPACVLNTPIATGSNNTSFTVSGSNSAQVTITQLVDNLSAQSLPSSIELNLPVICNASHRVIVRSANGGLLRAGAAPSAARTAQNGEFAEFLVYDVALDWSGQRLERSSRTGNAVLASSRPAAGDLRMRIATPAGTGPLIAGQYNDSIVLEFQVAN